MWCGVEVVGRVSEGDGARWKGGGWKEQVDGGNIGGERMMGGEDDGGWRKRQRKEELNEVDGGRRVGGEEMGRATCG